MRTGDNLNNYKNDVIDGYEKERQTEHRGEMLHGYPAYGDDGMFDESILITRMELANGLTFKSNILPRLRELYCWVAWIIFYWIIRIH